VFVTVLIIWLCVFHCSLADHEGKYQRLLKLTSCSASELRFLLPHLQASPAKLQTPPKSR